MTPLSDIKKFPATARKNLETVYGIGSAEAFYEHSVRNPDGMAAALSLSADELVPLALLVEGYLPAAFVTRCRQPVKKHSRGVILPTDKKSAGQ